MSCIGRKLPADQERTRRTIELLGRLDDVNVRAPDARPCDLEYLTLAFDHHRLNAQDIYDALVEFKSLPKIDDPTGLECFSNLDMPGSTGAEQREMREAKYLQDQIFDFLNQLELAVVWAEQNPNGAFDLPLLQKELDYRSGFVPFSGDAENGRCGKADSGFEASWPALYKDGKDWGCPKP